MKRFDTVEERTRLRNDLTRSFYRAYTGSGIDARHLMTGFGASVIDDSVLFTHDMLAAVEGMAEGARLASLAGDFGPDLMRVYEDDRFMQDVVDYLAVDIETRSAIHDVGNDARAAELARDMIKAYELGLTPDDFTRMRPPEDIDREVLVRAGERLVGPIARVVADLIDGGGAGYGLPGLVGKGNFLDSRGIYEIDGEGERDYSPAANERFQARQRLGMVRPRYAEDLGSGAFVLGGGLPGLEQIARGMEPGRVFLSERPEGSEPGITVMLVVDDDEDPLGPGLSRELEKILRK